MSGADYELLLPLVLDEGAPDALTHAVLHGIKRPRHGVHRLELERATAESLTTFIAERGGSKLSSLAASFREQLAALQ